MQTALRTILAGRTALIIAHRLSTVAIADRVLVVEGGRIAEDGPPERLLAGRGRFSALHASWRQHPGLNGADDGSRVPAAGVAVCRS